MLFFLIRGKKLLLLFVQPTVLAKKRIPANVLFNCLDTR
jgi:hypothetical protein